MFSKFKIILIATAAILVFPALAQQAKKQATVSELTSKLAEAQNNPQLQSSLMQKGKKAAAVCMNCHGENGNSLNPEIPNLAEQNPAYLLSQIDQFAFGKRKHEFMEGIMKALSTDEKIGVVLYYSSQRVTFKPPSSSLAVNNGKERYKTACASCHGEDGHGNEQLARVAGQQTKYLEKTLVRYKTGAGFRTDPTMAATTKALTNADISALIAYMSAMP
jgi:cytochrome c553